MSTILVLVSPQRATELAPEQAARWRDQIAAQLGKPDSARTTIDAAPFKASIEIDAGHQPDAVVDAVRNAFQSIGVAVGDFDLAISEHDEADVDFEAPPYFEHVLDLAGADGVAVKLSLSATLESHDPEWWIGKTPTEEQLQILEAELRSRLPHPIASCEVYRKMSLRDWGKQTALHVCFERCSPKSLPDWEFLKQQALAAATKAGIQLAALVVSAEDAAEDSVFHERVAPELDESASIIGSVTSEADAGSLYVAVRGTDPLLVAKLVATKLVREPGASVASAELHVKRLPADTTFHLRAFTDPELARTWARDPDAAEPPHATVTTNDDELETSFSM